jgi:hypothetical protein
MCIALHDAEQFVRHVGAQQLVFQKATRKSEVIQDLN